MTAEVEVASTAVAVEIETEESTPRIATSVSKDVAGASVRPIGKASLREPRVSAMEKAIIAAEEKVSIEISAEENLVALKMENNFLKLNAQIVELTKQAEQIQKQYPEYLKTLASKHGVDLTKYSFHALEGQFKRNQ